MRVDSTTGAAASEQSIEDEDSIPAGWYRDPDMAATLRYWDGEDWTEQVAPMPAPEARTPPAAAVPGGLDGWQVAQGALALVFGGIYVVAVVAGNGGVLVALTIFFFFVICMFLLRLLKLILVGTWR